MWCGACSSSTPLKPIIARNYHRVKGLCPSGTGHGCLWPWVDTSPHKMHLKGNLAWVSFLQTSVHLLLQNCFQKEKKKQQRQRPSELIPLKEHKGGLCGQRSWARMSVGEGVEKQMGSKHVGRDEEPRPQCKCQGEQWKPWKSQEAWSDFSDDFLLSYYLNRGWGTPAISKEMSWKAIWAS